MENIGKYLPLEPSRIISETNGYFSLMHYVDSLAWGSTYYNQPGIQGDRAAVTNTEKGTEPSAGSDTSN